MNTEAFSSVARESVNRLSSQLADEKLVTRMRMGAQRPPAAAGSQASMEVEVATGSAAAAKVEEGAGSAAVVAAPVIPAAPADELSALTLWVGREFRETLAAVRDLLSHAVPGGKKETSCSTPCARYGRSTSAGATAARSASPPMLRL